MITEAQPNTLLLSFPGTTNEPAREQVIEALTKMGAAAFKHYVTPAGFATFEGCEMLPHSEGEMEDFLPGHNQRAGARASGRCRELVSSGVTNCERSLAIEGEFCEYRVLPRQHTHHHTVVGGGESHMRSGW